MSSVALRPFSLLKSQGLTEGREGERDELKKESGGGRKGRREWGRKEGGREGESSGGKGGEEGERERVGREEGMERVGEGGRRERGREFGREGRGRGREGESGEGGRDGESGGGRKEGESGGGKGGRERLVTTMRNTAKKRVHSIPRGSVFPQYTQLSMASVFTRSWHLILNAQSGH